MARRRKRNRLTRAERRKAKQGKIPVLFTPEKIARLTDKRIAEALGLDPSVVVVERNSEGVLAYPRTPLDPDKVCAKCGVSLDEHFVIAPHCPPWAKVAVDRDAPTGERIPWDTWNTRATTRTLESIDLEYAINEKIIERLAAAQGAGCPRCGSSYELHQRRSLPDGGDELLCPHEVPQ